MIDLQKPLISATLGDFVQAMKNINPKIEEKPRKLVYGIAGLAELIGCSVPTAQKLKNSGKISFIQQGRKIIFDADRVLAELEKIGA
jgi:hypothetical protein